MPEWCFEFLQGPITETRPMELRQPASGLRETPPYKWRGEGEGRPGERGQRGVGGEVGGQRDGGERIKESCRREGEISK